MFRIITGIIVILFGLWLVYALLPESWVALIPGLVIVGIGVAILLNKKEDDIEEITSDEDKPENHE